MKVVPYIFGVFVLAIFGAIGLISYAPMLELTQYSLSMVYAGTVLLAVLTVVALWTEGEIGEQGKRWLMVGFLVATLVPTGYAVMGYTHTLYASWSGGEVHWHADYEVVVDEDGEYRQLDLIDPSVFCDDASESSYMCSLNDRVGVTEYHEHNDRRIHLEGTFKERQDATLRSFFQTFGGDLTTERLVYPTNDRVFEVEESGDKTLKVIMQTGIGGERGWCVLGEEVSEADRCRNEDTGKLASGPGDYVISPVQRGPVDKIWVVYDSTSTEQVLEDLREDGAFKQFGLEKTGEGY